MSEKFMRIKKVIVPAVCVMLAVIQLTGCGVATSEELVNMLSTGEQIEINIELPENSTELQGTPVEWQELSYLTDQEDLRKEIDNILGIISYGQSKNGVLYVNPETEEWEPNNTIEAVYKNKAYHELIEDEEIIEKINKAVMDSYTDIDETTDVEVIKLAALNAYFNIFPADETNAEFNGSAYLTRAQFMSGIAKAHLPAQNGTTASADTVEQIGDNEYSLYAELMSDSAYLDLASGSLNDKNINGLITRAEAAYMIVKTYYADELTAVDLESKPDTYSDVKNAGDMAAEAETTGQDQYKAANLSYMVENPKKGMDEELYKAMIVAYNHKVLGSETDSRWNEPVTKAEALQMFIRVYEEAGTTIKCQNGSNQSVDPLDLSMDDVENLSNELTYTINDKVYTASQLENAGTIALVYGFGRLPIMTYAEWAAELDSTIDSRKLEMYNNHLIATYDQNFKFGDTEIQEVINNLTSSQLLWLERMGTAMASGMTTKKEMESDYLILTEDEVDTGLRLLYLQGSLSDEEKVAYEDIYDIKKPEVTYQRNESTAVASETSGQSDNNSNSVENYNESNYESSGMSPEEVIAAQGGKIVSRETPGCTEGNGGTLYMP